MGPLELLLLFIMNTVLHFLLFSTVKLIAGVRWNITDCVSGALNAKVEFFPIQNDKFSIIEGLPDDASFKGNCSRNKTTIDLQFDWHSMNGNQKLNRRLKIKVLKNEASNELSLKSVMFNNELKEHMSEYIVAVRNNSSPSIQEAKSLKLEATYHKPHGVVEELTDAILTVDRLDLSKSEKSGNRGGRNLERTSLNAEENQQTSTSIGLRTNVPTLFYFV